MKSSGFTGCFVADVAIATFIGATIPLLLFKLQKELIEMEQGKNHDR